MKASRRSVITLAMAALASGLGTPHATGAAPPAPPRPNVILVLSDDVGLSRIGCYGGAPFATPHLDRLAAQGVRFERAYSMPICGPSRAALLTGKYPFRTGAVGNGSSVVDPQKHPTLPLLLQRAGYATCAIGKLGQSAPEGDTEAPARLGFDEFMLWMGRGTPDRYWNPRYHRHDGVFQGRPDQYGPDVTHDFLVDFMQRHRDRPFFVYYSAVLTHFPFTRTPDSKDDTRVVEDMVAYLDKTMGRLADDLDRLGLRDNTILLFTSDNGPQGKPPGTIRGRPMIGEKGDTTEGGVRTPLIVNCPALVPGGRVCPDLTDFTDLLPTVLDLAAVPVPADLGADGLSLAPQILGRPGRPRNWVYAQHGRDFFVADHRWKLYGDGRLVDIADSPVAETPAANDDPEAAGARKRLAAAMAALRGTATDAPSAGAARLTAEVPGDADAQAARLRADLRSLQQRGIVADADAWLAAAKAGDAGFHGGHVAALIVSAAAAIKPADDLAGALALLGSEGVVRGTAYWTQNARDGGTCSRANVARLVNKIAQRLERR